TAGSGDWSESVLHTFTFLPDGANPDFLSIGPDNTLYGTAGSGGGGCGSAFALTPQSGGVWTFTVLHGFSEAHDGCLPVGLVQDVQQNLYGSTRMGGRVGDGSVYELIKNPDGTFAEKRVHSFTGVDGSMPGSGGVVVDSAGNLLGVTLFGGANGSG